MDYSLLAEFLKSAGVAAPILAIMWWVVGDKQKQVVEANARADRDGERYTALAESLMKNQPVLAAALQELTTYIKAGRQ